MAQILNFKDPYIGLSPHEAENNLKMYGYNTESKLLSDDVKIFKISRVFLSFRFIIMLIAALLQLFNRDTIISGCVMMLLLAFYAAVEIYKGVKSENAFYALKDSTSQKQRVVRDGEIMFIHKEYLVPDDIIVLQSGENVPADCYLLEIDNLTVDESIFAGTKTIVPKMVGVDSSLDELKSSCIYKGTKIESGCLVGRVTATGVDTHYHKAFKEQPAKEIYYTKFETTINKVMPYFSIVAALMLVLSVIFVFLATPIDTKENVFKIICSIVLPSIAFALCFIPAETASVVRSYYLYGASRLAAKNSIVKELGVIEKLNALTTICIEKSGTITRENVEIADEYSKNSEIMDMVAVLACKKTPSSNIDKAIFIYSTFKHISIDELHQNMLVKEYSFDEKTHICGNLWNVSDAQLLCIKGSPESIYTLCNMDLDTLSKVTNRQSFYSKNGYQVIAVAYTYLSVDEAAPNSIADKKYRFIGLIAFDSKTKESISMAIRSCYKSGVNVIITTGDNPETAAAIANKIGIKSGNVLLGEELQQITDDSLDTLKDVNIFARTSSAQKLQAVKLLQKSGEIVAITGDSTTPSDLFETADVSIAMAQNAGGAAYDACKLLMNDDNLSSIVDTIKQSRQIHQNIKHAISTVMSSYTALVIFSIINLFVGGELLFTPVLVALLTICIVPVAAFLYIDNYADIKSELYSSSYIGKGTVNKKYFLMSVVQGACLGIVSLMFYFLSGNGDIMASRSAFLIVFVSGLIAMCYENIASRRYLFGTLKHIRGYTGIFSGILVAFTLLIIYFPFVNTAFGFAFLDPFLLIIGIILGVFSQIWVEIAKFVSNSKK